MGERRPARLARAMSLCGVLLATGCGDNAGGAATDASVSPDASTCIPPGTELTAPAATCEEAVPLSSGDHVTLDLTEAPAGQTLCSELAAPAIAWFTVDVPAGERLAVQPQSLADRVLLWLADSCQSPAECVPRVPPSNLASSSVGLVWGNDGAETRTMIVEASAPDTCGPFELDVAVGPQPANAVCDGAITLTSGQQTWSDGRLSTPPPEDSAGSCPPTGFPMYYRVAVPDGQNLELIGADVLMRDCDGAGCVPPELGGYAQYRNRSGDSEELIAVARGFAPRGVTATVALPASNVTCGAAIDVATDADIDYRPAFASEDVTTLSCDSTPTTDAMYYRTQVPAHHGVVVDGAPDLRGAVFASCATDACQPGLFLNDTDSVTTVIVRAAHDAEMYRNPGRHDFRVTLAAPAPTQCADATALEVTDYHSSYHLLTGTATSREMCGETVYGVAYFEIEIPTGYWLRASVSNLDDPYPIYLAMVLDGCDSDASCPSAAETVTYPGFNVGVDATRTVTLAIGHLRADQPTRLFSLMLELQRAN